MNNQEFVEYAAKRFGIDESVAETFVDMFTQSLQELINAGQSVDIEDIGKFTPISLLPKNFNHRNNLALAKAAKRKIISFTPSEKLSKSVA